MLYYITFFKNWVLGWELWIFFYAPETNSAPPPLLSFRVQKNMNGFFKQNVVVWQRCSGITLLSTVLSYLPFLKLK